MFNFLSRFYWLCCCCSVWIFSCCRDSFCPQEDSLGCSRVNVATQLIHNSLLQRISAVLCVICPSVQCWWKYDAAGVFCLLYSLWERFLLSVFELVFNDKTEVYVCSDLQVSCVNEFKAPSSLPLLLLYFFSHFSTYLHWPPAYLYSFLLSLLPSLLASFLPTHYTLFPSFLLSSYLHINYLPS